MADTLLLNACFPQTAPDPYLPMGHSVERLARKFGITREESDRYALESHRRALAAQDSGYFAEEITPVELGQTSVGDSTAEPVIFDRDEGPRRDTSLEALTKLK